MPDQPVKKPKYVYAREPDQDLRGELTGGTPRRCGLESCRGHLVGVRWPADRRLNPDRTSITFPCTAGMFIRPDGDWQIK